MITLSREEFAPRRRSEQDEIEGFLRPYVQRALDGTINTRGYGELINAIRAAWNQFYALQTDTEKHQVPHDFIQAVNDTLKKTDRPGATNTTVNTIASWLATAITSHASVKAAEDAEDDLLLEWVDMNDDRVRHAHAEADGQTVKPGESFTVGGEKMPYPGYPGVSIELWINCRCSVRPKLAQEALVATFSTGPDYAAIYDPFRDVSTEERKKDAKAGRALPDGSFPIDNCSDLRNAIQAIGRAKDPAKAKAHIRKRKSALGCPDVDLPDTWAIEEAAAGWGAPSETVTDKPKKKRTACQMEGYEGVTHAGLAVQAMDTGRILMIQRSLDQDDAPDVQGTWEFPGGGLDEGESPEEAARREFAEETGLAVPEGEIVGGWRSEDGVYQGFVHAVDIEREAFGEINPDLAAAEAVNPDDPERRRPDVSAWFSIEQIKAMGCALRPECHNTDWSQFSEGGGDVWQSETDPEEDTMPEDEMTNAARLDALMAATGNLTPWHGVLTVEGKKTGDNRRFSVGSMRTRPLPLPLTWQKVSTDGHDNAVTVARIDREVRVPMEDGTTEIRANGVMLNGVVTEADEVIGLIAEFGRFGVSVDADDATMTMDPETGEREFTDARSAGSCIVAIPAFHEAWVALGEIPEGFYDGGTDLEQVHGEGETADESLVAAVGVPTEQQFVDIAPGKTEDGPGWLTHPVETDRLRDWWASAESGVGWGTPGDFNRCRAKAAEHVKPQYVNGFCANRHYDALGTWPGRGAHAAETLQLTDTTPAEPLTLVASRFTLKASADWFRVPEPDHVQPFVITDEGQVYGHIADWKTCHGNTGAYGECMIAPRSPSGYANFLLGYVETDEGPIPTGCLTIGGGHANGRLSMRDAQRHYDDSTAAWADVHVIDGEHGIWACGWVRPGTSEEMVVAARASKLSGDWRRGPHGLDMIAALAVNAPGFAIPRVAANLRGGEVYSLVAAGVVDMEVSAEASAAVDLEALADQVAERVLAAQLRRESLQELAAEFDIDMDDEMARIAQRVRI